MLSAQSTTKDYIKAEHKLHSISKSFISQVTIPQVMFFFFFFVVVVVFSLVLFRGHPAKEPAPSRVTYFILRAFTETGVSQSQHR